MTNERGLVGLSTAETGRFSVCYGSIIAMSRPDNVLFTIARGAVISKNRNDITEAALKHGAAWVLYLDDDHIFPSDILQRLLAADKDVVSAHYIQRQPPFNPVAMERELPNGTFVTKQLKSTDQGLVKVAATGAGCLLVKRRVLEALQPPYWTLGQIHPATWGDDLHFCSRVAKAGFDIWVDLDARIGHMMAGVVVPVWDDKKGWVARFAQDHMVGPIAEWPMPLGG